MSAPPRSIVVEKVRYPAGSYLLEGELAYPEADSNLCGTVVVAGSHPLLGGNMQNNVVRSLGDGLAERGFVTLRFNYRGVGASEGPPVNVARQMAEFWRTSHVSGEADHWQDLQGALNFLRETAGSHLPVALVGYSFGCSLLSAVHVPGGAAGVVLLAPTVARHDYTSFRSVTAPTLVVASEDDFATDSVSLHHWFDQLEVPKRRVVGDFDNHFFRGHEDWLVATVSDFLEGCRR
jgi:alpha/beta superfamily hydrolase